jgi:lysozyme
MKTSKAGIELIKAFEGLRCVSYKDAVGIWTVGYGHTGPDVKPNTQITSAHAEILLKADLASTEKAVENLVKVPINQHQFDALVSFCFNVGSGALGQSTLLKRLNAGEDPNTVAREELPRWNKGDGKILEGLSRRRTQEVEVFCSAAPELKTGTVEITSNTKTWFKKRPIPSTELSNNEKSSVVAKRTIRNCKVLDKKDKHTLLELGFGLGKWWVFDEHWEGLVTTTEVKPYATTGDLRYLRNFPYFYQVDNGPQGWRQCQSSSIAMCLKYLDVPGINDDIDYLKIVNKYGDSPARYPHICALKELNVDAKFTQTADEQDVKDQIDKGKPVVAGILHHGAVSDPSGSGHFVVISGYGDGYWLVQDPYGELDLVNGGWAKTGAEAGKNVRYSFKNTDPRFFVEGGGSGWCWLNFKKL